MEADQTVEAVTEAASMREEASTSLPQDLLVSLNL